jgi:pimeloyl-ACP methyl ester carboxylesterase
VSDALVSVFLPGTLCDERIFMHMPADPLARHLHYRDLRDVSAWWATQLAQLPERFDCIGFSLGGIMAMALLQLQPERVRKLVLWSSNADAAGEPQRLRCQQQANDWDVLGPRGLIEEQLKLLDPSPRLEPNDRRLLQDMAQDTPPTSFLAQLELNSTRANGHEILRQWNGPVQLIAGDADPWCGPAVQERILASRPDARLSLIPGVSHYSPLEAPAESAVLMQAFLES